jgi:flagellar basal body-associated protein FliL
MRYKNKSGQSAVIVIIFTLFALFLFIAVGFAFFAIKPAYDDLVDDLVIDMELSPESEAILRDTNESYPVWLDNGFLWVIAGVWFSLLIMAYYSVDHPILLIILFIVWVVLILAGAYISNIWTEFSEGAEYDLVRTEFRYTDFFLGRMPHVIMVMGFSCMLVYFWKNSSGGIG